jgi:hypothetical protein
MAKTENVKIIRLLNGEDLIGEVVHQDDVSVQVKHPLRVVLVPSKANPEQPAVGLGPYAEYSDEKTFTFNRSHVTVMYTPITEFINQYNSMFGGLVVPNSKILTP